MNMDNPFKIKPHITIHILSKVKIKKTLEAKMCKIDYTCTSTFAFNLKMAIYCHVLRYCYFYYNFSKYYYVKTYIKSINKYIVILYFMFVL